MDESGDFGPYDFHASKTVITKVFMVDRLLAGEEIRQHWRGKCFIGGVKGVKSPLSLMAAQAAITETRK